MTKYDERFKLKAVEQYARGQASYQGVASAFGIDVSQLRRWVASYRWHGQAGLARKVGRYNAPFKLEVLERAQRDGLSDRQAAALYDIRSTAHVGLWRRQYDAGGLGALEPKRKGRPKLMKKKPLSTQPASPQGDDTRTREEVLKENEYLRAEVAYLKKLKALIDAERSEALAKKRGSSKD